MRIQTALAAITLVTLMLVEHAYAWQSDCPVIGAKSASSRPPLDGNHKVGPASPYPIRDQIRSLIRFVREQLALTPHHMQALGFSYDQTLEVLAQLREHVEPLESRLESARENYRSTQFASLSIEGKLFSVEQRLERVDAANSELCAELEAEQAQWRSELPLARQARGTAEHALNALLAPIGEAVGAQLTPRQRQAWEAVQVNAVRGLPMNVWFVPGLDDRQVTALQQGASESEVLTDEQRAVAEASQEHYTACREDVQRAEAWFFFGRESASARPAAQADVAPAESVCPHHARSKDER